MYSNRYLLKSKIITNMKVFLPSFFVIPVAVVLLFVIMRLVVPAIFLKSDELGRKKEEVASLSSRVGVLNEARVDALENYEKIFKALPVSNPVVLLAYQVSRLAIEQGVLVSDFDVKGMRDLENDLSEINLSFLVQSNSVSAVADFLISLRNIAPIMSIDRVDLEYDDDIPTTEITLITHWSGLPKSIMGSEALGLTSEESALLSQVLNLTHPDALDLSPQAPIQRVSPF
jgi:hypothetical protein